MSVTYEMIKQRVDEINAGTWRNRTYLQVIIDKSKPVLTADNINTIILETIINSIEPTDIVKRHDVFNNSYYYTVKEGTHLDDDPMAIFYLLTQVENQINKIKDAQDRVAFYVLLILWIAVFLPFLCIGILLVI